jgi:hypothetical protein
MGKYILEKVTMTGILVWLNNNYIKQNNKPFTLSDVEGYCRRGYFPSYIGERRLLIHRDKNLSHLKIYNIE